MADFSGAVAGGSCGSMRGVYLYLAAVVCKAGGAGCLTCVMLGAGHKVLAFAHHAVIMDGLEEAVRAEGAEHVRIDGHSSPLQKKAACDRFQTCGKVKAAILSITAAGVSPPCCPKPYKPCNPTILSITAAGKPLGMP